MVTRLDILQQRRQFLVEQYRQYRSMFYNTTNLVTKASGEQRLNILGLEIREVDNLLLKEVSK